MNVKYRVIHGLDYRDHRAEPGDIVEDLPAKSVDWLLKQGHILPHKKGARWDAAAGTEVESGDKDEEADD